MPRFALQKRVATGGALLLALGCMLLGGPASAFTAAGVAIENQATLTFTDGPSGLPLEVRSNTSRVVVATVRRMDFGLSGELSRLPGERVDFAHQLSNQGNAPDRFLVDAMVIAGELDAPRVVHDENGNGFADEGEPELAGFVSLAPAEVIDLVFSASVSSIASHDDLIRVSVTAMAESSDALNDAPTPISLTDTVTVITPALPLLVVVSAPECSVVSQAGDPLAVAMSVWPAAGARPLEREILVSGMPERGVLVELPLPDGVMPGALEDFSSNIDESLLLAGDAGGNWTKLESTTLMTAERIAWLIPVSAMDVSTSARVSMPFQVDRQAPPESIQFSASIDTDGDGQFDVERLDSCVHAVDQSIPPPPVVRPTEGAIRFVLPQADLRREVLGPSFSNDADYVDTDVYELATGRVVSSLTVGEGAISYEPLRDGVYVEFNGTPGDTLVARSAEGVNHMPVRVSSSAAGAETVLWLRETVPGSDTYRSLMPLALGLDVDNSDACPASAEAAFTVSIPEPREDAFCSLASDHSDVLVVTPGVDVSAATGSSNTIMDIAVTDAASVVFDASGGSTLAGVRVTVIDAELGSDTIAEHPQTGAALVFVTDTQGRFALPRLDPTGRYAINVLPPDRYSFPSVFEPDTFVDRNVSAASYGIQGPDDAGMGIFTVEPEAVAPVVDVPLDPMRPAAALGEVLLLDKSVDQDVVEIGEAISYTIVVENEGEQALEDIQLTDTPPPGFVYIASSSRRDGEAIPDPVEEDADDRLTMRYALGRLEPGEQIELAYALQAGARAEDGVALNTAVASASALTGEVVATAPTSARVRLIRSGAFGERGMIFGKVYVDASCDGIQNQREWPVPGVRLYLEDGRFVITDEDGLYSLVDVSPGLHVLKVDESTVPYGLTLKPLSTRNAADAGSRFVPLISGEWHRADVAAYCPQQNASAVLAELDSRRDKLAADWVLDEASRYDPDSRRPLANDTSRANADGDLGSGWLGYDAERHANSQRDDADSAQLDSDQQNALTSPVSEGMGDPQELVANITRTQGEAGTFLWPTDGISDDGRFMVVVRGGVAPTLYINDEPVAGTQIGERIENLRESAQVAAWYGVMLEPGINQVEVRGRDAFGNERVLAQTEVRRPARAARMILRAPDDELPADGGRTRLPIDILITDADGTPASGVRFVTLQTTRGGFDGEDLQSYEPGHQVRVEKGRTKVYLKSSERAGRLRVSAESGRLNATLNLVQLTAPRPLIALGVVELGASLATHAEDDLPDGIETDSRAAVFIKGGVRGDMELTLAYDSDKPDDTELLETLPSDAPYPLTGDASLQGFEAQSRSQVYARLERNRSSVMWGDYLTDSQSDLDDLARTQRTLTGFNGVFDTGRTRIQAFAAEQSDERSVEIIPGNGTALLYSLQDAPLVANSEIIERIVKSQDNSGLILSSERLVAGIDYRLDPVTGFLRFSDVIPSTNDAGDPVFIRASYDTDGDGSEHLIAGLRISQSVGISTFLGASYTEDQNPEAGFRITGAQLRYVFGGDPASNGGATLGAVPWLGSGNTELTVSGAFMQHEDEREGHAARVGLNHTWGGQVDKVTRISWARAEADFDNPGSGIAAGRTEWRLEHRHPFGKKTRLLIDALESSSTSDTSRYRSAGFRVERDAGAWTLGLGVRRIHSVSPSESLTFTTALASAARRFFFSDGKSGRVSVEYEQALDEADRNRIVVEGRIGVSRHVDVYARYEREQGVASRSLLGLGGDDERLVAGVNSDWLPGTELFSEYRLSGAFDGRDMETASGFRGRYELQPGLSITPSFEVINSLRGNETDAVAVSLGVSDTRAEHRRISAQAEYRHTENDEYIGIRASLAQRLTRDWTMVATEEFTRLFPSSGETTIRQELSFSAARRPKHDNRQHSLWLLEWKYDRSPAFDGDTDRFILSTHQNREFGANATLSGRLAGKWQRLELGSQATWQRASLASARLSLEFARRWEVDVGGGMLATGEGRGFGSDELAWSAGVGVSWLAMKNLALELRWNGVGFSDPDLDSAGVNEAGVRLGLQYKFDEGAFGWLSE